MEQFFSHIKSITTIPKAVKLLERYCTITPKIQHAIDSAIKAHEGQLRKSKEPYVIHPLMVACIVAQISNEEHMIIAAILHDVVEDTKLTIEFVRTHFGEDVAHLVEGMTKIVEIREEKLLPADTQNSIAKSALSFRKMLIASTKDVRVLIVKLCDRLHNMLTLDALTPAKQLRIAEETMVVYAPIAHRLGVSMLKNKLEDYSFKYLLATEYEKVNNYIKSHHQDFWEIINSFINSVTKLMLKNGFAENSFKIFGRVKHHYSIYMKIQRKGISIDEVLDLLAIRILVPQPLDCYKVQGILHLHYKPLMARVKDYIAAPKENGYQTIHTTVFDNRSLIEVQIRTFGMHQTAELGVAAHWKYKTGESGISLQWLNNLSGQSDNVEAFMDLASKDLYSNEITVFSPKGDVFTLPRGSVVLDFAYAVHTDVGSFAKEAYINKEKATLLTQLKNGDLVEIKTGDTMIVRHTWVDAVQTSKARHSLLHYSNIRNQEIGAKVSINILHTLLKKPNDQILFWLKNSKYVKNFYKASLNSATLRKIYNAYMQEHRPKSAVFKNFWQSKKRIKEQIVGHFVFYHNKSINEVQFDYCCHPKKGDEIVAFKEKSKALIHHKMCDMIESKINEGKPMLFVRWNDERTFSYHLIVSLYNSKGALANFLLYLAKIDIDIVSIELGNKESSQIQYCTLLFQTKESNASWLKEKISQATRIIEFVRKDDIYKNS